MAKVTLLGTIGADASLKVINDTRMAINFSVCENISVKNGKGESIRVAQWFNVSYFSNTDNMVKHLLKGKRVFVSGNLRFSEFKSEQTGEVKRSNDIFADTLEPIEWVKADKENESKHENPVSAEESDNLPF